MLNNRQTDGQYNTNQVKDLLTNTKRFPFKFSIKFHCKFS